MKKIILLLITIFFTHASAQDYEGQNYEIEEETENVTYLPEDLNLVEIEDLNEEDFPDELSVDGSYLVDEGTDDNNY